MRFYPDILDDAGKTPREFGSHQLHVEPVAVEDGFGWALIWFQAAFEPCDPRATFEVRVPETGEVLLAAQRVPDVSGGRVARGLVRFAVRDELAEIAVSVTSALDEEKSERCRQAWKLFDTLQMPKERRVLRPGNDSREPVLEDLTAGSTTTLKRHQARALPPMLTVKLDRSRPPPALAEGFTIAWKPGDAPLEREWQPPPVPPKRVAPITGYRECVKCDFSGAWKDFGEDEQCPQCGYWW